MPTNSSSMRRRVGAFATVAVLGVCVVPAAALGGSGKSVKLHSGSVTITFSPSVYAALTKQTTGPFAVNNTMAPVVPATEKTSQFSFPISGGKLTLSTLKGKVSTKGGINLMDSKTVGGFFTTTSQGELVSFRFNFGGSAQLILNFVGSSTTKNVPFATLVTKKAKHSVHGKSVSVTHVAVKLTKTGAQLMNSFVSGFKTGEQIGTASIAAKS